MDIPIDRPAPIDPPAPKSLRRRDIDAIEGGVSGCFRMYKHIQGQPTGPS